MILWICFWNGHASKKQASHNGSGLPAASKCGRHRKDGNNQNRQKFAHVSNWEHMWRNPYCFDQQKGFCGSLCSGVAERCKDCSPLQELGLRVKVCFLLVRRLTRKTTRQHQEGMVHHLDCISTTKSNHWHLCVTLSPDVDVLHPYPYWWKVLSSKRRCLLSVREVLDCADS